MNTPKATIADLQDEGFVSSQFGMPEDFDTPTIGYLARVLKSASLWVEQKCGPAVYAAMPEGSYAEDSARQAEVQYAAMVLYRRRYAYYEGNAASGNNKDEAMVLAELRRQAEAALQNALYWLAESLRASGVDESSLFDGSGLASGVVETGRYPLTSSAIAGVS